MSSLHSDPVKEQVAAHWDRRAAHFDEDFGHSIRTAAERAAWDRIFGLVLRETGPLDALDAGSGTGFLSLELAARGHRVTGVDFAPSMIARAERKAAERGLAVRFEQGDAEQLRFAPASFDLVISRHVLWTLPHPEAAIDEWIRVLRPGARLVVVDGAVLDGSDRAAGAQPGCQENARTSPEYEAVGDQLPFLGGRPRREIETLLRTHGLVNVESDPLADLVEAQVQRMVEEGLAPRRRTATSFGAIWRADFSSGVFARGRPCSRAAAAWGAISTASPATPRKARACASPNGSPPSVVNTRRAQRAARCAPLSTISATLSPPAASRAGPSLLALNAKVRERIDRIIRPQIFLDLTAGKERPSQNRN